MGVTRVGGYTTRSGRHVGGYTQRRRGSRLSVRRLAGGISSGRRIRKKKTASLSGTGRSAGTGRVRRGSVIGSSASLPTRTRNNSSVSQTPVRTATTGRSVLQYTSTRHKRKQSGSRGKPASRRAAILQTGPGPGRKRRGRGTSIVNQGKPKAAPKGGNKMPQEVGDLGAFYTSVQARVKAGQVTPSRKPVTGANERARRKRRKRKA